MQGNREIIKTADGSVSLQIAGTYITYHSHYGALTESRHIFLHTGLHYAWEQKPDQEIVQVLETGFGSGLNALLTAGSAATQQRMIRYTTLEPYPINKEIWSMLHYKDLDQTLLYQLHEAAWDQDIRINDFFILHKSRLGIREFPEDTTAADVVYFDAFAPEDQPELWTPDIFRLLFNRMSAGSVLTTYCAKGAIRRSMQAAGFTTQRLAGPPGGKREILRALKS